MDQAYGCVAGAYGFHCRGCEDNCCYSRFYHHTLLEYAYLHQGMGTLDHGTRETILQKAADVVAQSNSADKHGHDLKIMCPLNAQGRCLLYTFRPMVCRLHGLDHELCKPGQAPVKSIGCDLFRKQTEQMMYIPFDRTPFYKDMAQLESEFRLKTGIMDRMKYTIAEMLLL
ncbi:MAG: hypothetical protein KKD44_01720 [Proteobacteria bacterium]|nr:hypothetical protein [Pseudomonadota bacterium]